MNEVRVNRKAADRVASGHPWIFSSDVADRGGAQAGRPSRSPIRAAVRSAPPITAPLPKSPSACSRGRSKRSAAISFCAACAPPKQHRRTVVRDSDAYRVVHGEADLLPALVVDRYGDYLVMQTLDQGMDAAKAEIASCLEEIFQPKGIVARNDVAVRAKEELPLETTVLAGEIPESVDRPHERTHPARRPAARPEDRHLPRPARKLSRRRPLRPRRQGARLLHLHRRLRAPPGREVRTRRSRR